MNRIAYGLCLLAVLALGVGGCGGSDSTSSAAYGENSGSTTEKETTKPATSNGRDGSVTVVFRAESATLGRILFDENGYTLYRFSKDQGPTSSCYGACAKQWPPLFTEGQLKARKTNPNQLGTTERKGGTLQVTYYGHPLYKFAGDEATGEASGNGVTAFGGKWHSMHPDGKDADE